MSTTRPPSFTTPSSTTPPSGAGSARLPAGPHDLRRAARWTAALLLPVGPAVITAGRMGLPYWTTDSPAQIVDGILGDRAWMSAMQWAGAVASPALLLGVLALHRLARRGSPRLAAAGAALAFTAYACWGAAGNSEQLVLAGADAGVSRDALLAVGTAVDGSALSMATGLLWVFGHIIGTVLLGVALLRARAVPRWAAWLLVISQPLHFVAAVVVPSRALDFVGWGGTTLACAVAAWCVLRTRDDDWDLPSRSTSSPLAQTR